MTTRPVTRLLSADEFMALPDLSSGAVRELVRGEVVHMTPPGGTHGMLANRLAFRLTEFVEQHALGIITAEVTLRISRDPDTLRVPDAAFFAAGQIRDGHLPDSYVDDAPTLAIEVVSLHDRDVEISDKLTDYFAFGIPRVWIVRKSNRTVTVHRPDGTARTYGAGDTLTSDEAGFAVEGFALAVASIFA